MKGESPYRLWRFDFDVAARAFVIRFSVAPHGFWSGDVGGNMAGKRHALELFTWRSLPVEKPHSCVIGSNQRQLGVAR
jgi:hypothetical protein